MRNRIIALCLFTGILTLLPSGCTDPAPIPTPRFGPVPHKVTVVVVLDKYHRFDCIDRGGIWVKGDSKNYTNELVGCIEPEEKQ